MKDTDLMPWGVHVYKKLGEVPFDYLYNCYKSGGLGGEKNADLLKWFEAQLKVIEESENAIRELTGQKPKKYLIDSTILPTYEERKNQYK